ncbi:MAG: hypothetical protein OXG76_14315 [Acidimicrobiaceae bacterium]|nr:hypothetical protein [Acidimicrobiaceae bacterium]
MSVAPAARGTGCPLVSSGEPGPVETAVAGIAMCIAARSAARHQAARSRAAAGIVVNVLALLAWVLLVIAAISALNDFFT